MDKDYLFQKMNPGKALANVFGVSAALFFPLLFIYLKTFELLSGAAVRKRSRAWACAR